jgi:hypothetical protein
MIFAFFAQQIIAIGNETSITVKSWKILDCLWNYFLLKKESASWR